MKLLVTGGSGRVGECVVDYLGRKHDVTVFDRDIDENHEVKFIQGDILNFDTMQKAVEGMEAVVHMAAIPSPNSASHEDVFETNVVGTFYTAESARRAGITRYVLVSSESIYGWAYGGEKRHPHYLPIDEEHPIEPEDPYGLSKQLAEQVCKMYARLGMKTISLRPSYVWMPENNDQLMQMVDDPDKWWKNLWAYVHTEDVAQAIDLSLTADLHNNFEAFLVNAADNASRLTAGELREKYYPHHDLHEINLDSYESFVSTAKAKKLLGYEPKHSWRELE